MLLTKVKLKNLENSSNIELEKEIERILSINMVSGIVFEQTVDLQFLNRLPSYIDWYIEISFEDSFRSSCIEDWIRFGVKKLIVAEKVFEKVQSRVDPSLLLTILDISTKTAIKNEKLIDNQGGKKLVLKLSSLEEFKIRTENKNRNNLIYYLNFDINLDSLYSLFLDLLKFDKISKLIPIVTTDQDTVLMVAYANIEALNVALTTQKMTYYSRSRKRLWTKGETSGNIQKLRKLRYDCDRDTILATVVQSGNTCHLMQETCFGDKGFNFEELFRVIKARIQGNDKRSFTRKIASNEQDLLEKIREESSEVINYNSLDNLIWEVGDLIYFIFILMAEKGISLENIKNELRRRRKCK